MAGKYLGTRPLDCASRDHRSHAPAQPWRKVGEFVGAILLRTPTSFSLSLLPPLAKASAAYLALVAAVVAVATAKVAASTEAAAASAETPAAAVPRLLTNSAKAALS